MWDPEEGIRLVGQKGGGRCRCLDHSLFIFGLPWLNPMDSQRARVPTGCRPQTLELAPRAQSNQGKVAQRSWGQGDRQLCHWGAGWEGWMPSLGSPSQVCRRAQNGEVQGSRLLGITAGNRAHADCWPLGSGPSMTVCRHEGASSRGQSDAVVVRLPESPGV